MQERFEARKNALVSKIRTLGQQVDLLHNYKLHGNIISASGTVINAYLPAAKIGDLCFIYNNNSELNLYAEIVALDRQYVRLLPFGNIGSISQDCRVYRISDNFRIPVGNFLLGKIINGFGDIIGGLDKDHGEAIPESVLATAVKLPISGNAPDPLERPLIDRPIVTGVTALDMFTTCGLGQRIGIFAGPGMGKTTLMGMILRNAEVDVLVIVLIGERGREVREFIDLELNPQLRKRCVLVVATSDRTPVEQVKCAYVAQTVAEYFRDQGKNVLLVFDSLTRFARAQREVGLSAGEPVTRGGYPPSVFLSFPRLLERAGRNRLGSITAFYTVLAEGPINEDPIAEEVKSITDGHIILSRKLAEMGQFPAIDILVSLSRIADRIIKPDHLAAARHIRLLVSKYKELEFLIRVGEYKAGQDKLADEAINKQPRIVELLKQPQSGKTNFDASLKKLISLAKS